MNRSYRLSFGNLDIDPIEDLRIVFEVDKATGIGMNHGVIRVFNLNPSNRNKLAQAYHNDTPFTDPVNELYLYAGYDGNNIQLLEGDILTAYNYRVGADWITEIEVFTGIAKNTFSTTNVSYSQATPAKQIVEDILSSLGLDIQYTAQAIKSLHGEKPFSFSDAGNSIAKANEFLQRYDLSCMIMDNKIIQVYKNDLPLEDQTNKNIDNTFNIESGLIGTPKITRSGVEFTALLRPEVNILQRIYVESQTINETLQNAEDFTNEYFIKGLKHIGDSRGDEWFTTIEAAYVNILKGNYNA